MGGTGGIFTALGGVGLFLLGMVLMTEGLQGLAGQSLRRGLRRFTSTPLRGVMAGTAVTAILQSSSATTVTVVGFVSAGLLSFPQGLGIVFGANIGTTFTGWLVALLGFRLDLEAAALPLIFVGGMLRLFGGRRLAHGGSALAGFALLFLGIATMQQGMAGLEGVLTPDRFPGDTFAGRAKLVLIGAAVTAVTQSSSAGVAAALVALDAGAIQFAQAAVMVIGMNIGTTVTALLATLGGSVAARQTGMAHLLFNLSVGVLAFFLLWPAAPLAEAWVARHGAGAGQLALVIFHTAFNLVGVGIALAVLDPFVKLVRALVRERREPLVARLDNRLLVQPGAAVDAAGATVEDIARHLSGLLAARLSPQGPAKGDGQKLRNGLRALETTRVYVEKINGASLHGPVQARYLDILHILDHLARLGFRISQEDRALALAEVPRLRRLSAVTRAGLVRVLGPGETAAKAAWFGRLQDILGRNQRRLRDSILEGAGRGQVDTGPAIARIDAARWLHRVAYHIWRIQYHLERIERSRDEVVGSAARAEALADLRAD